MRVAWMLLVLMPVALSAADVTGKWVCTVELDAGSGERVFNLKQDGEKLTGTSTGQLGEAAVTGTVKGDSIEMRFTVKSDAGEIEATFTGKITGDTMKGKAVYGGLASGTFAARRASA